MIAEEIKHKDSGVEWIGEIPEGWIILKLKRILTVQSGDFHKSDNDAESGYKIYGGNGFRGYSKSFNHSGPLIIVGRVGANCGNVHFIDGDKWITEHAFKVIQKTTCDLKYLTYLLRVLNLNQFAIRTAQPLLNTSLVLDRDIPYPSSIETQKSIAAFLDRKTALIDELIEKKERMIKLLEEQRQATIHQTVTKGLDSNVPMKDSGIEWIGEIPEHWEVVKLKYVLESLNYKRIPLSGEERASMLVKKYDYYGASGIIDQVENYIFDEDTILIGEDGANLLSRSSRLAFIARGKYWVNNHAHILRPKQGVLEYFAELLEQINYMVYVTGSAQPKLTQEQLANIFILNPPKEEQRQIADFLIIKNDHCNQLIKKEKGLIEVIREYKSSLIFNAVIGKIQVDG